MKNRVLLAVAACIVFSGPVEARRPPEISGLELQQMQAREYDASVKVSFPAVMTVLQDAGYRIIAADRDTGLITGAASTNSHMAYSLFGGFGKSKKTPMVSAFIEDRGGGSRVRLSFVMSKAKSSLYGMSSADEEPIFDPMVYREAFEKIDKEMFVRLSLQAAKPLDPPAALPPVAAPVPVVTALPLPPAVSPIKN